MLVKSKEKGGGKSAGDNFWESLTRGLPSMRIADGASRRRRTAPKGSGSGGVGEVTNAIAFMKSLTDGDGDGKRRQPHLASSTLFGGRLIRKSAEKSASSELAERPGEESFDNMHGNGGGGLMGSGMARSNGGRKGSVSLARNFFVKKAGARHSMSAESNAASREKAQAADANSLLDAKRFLTRQAEVLVAVVVTLGLYDFLCGYFGAVGIDASELATLLLVRYCGFVPLLLLTRQLIATSGDAPSPYRVLAFSIGLILVPTAALLADIALVGDEIRPCPVVTTGHAPIPLCPSEIDDAAAFSSPPAPGSPPPLQPIATPSAIPAAVCALGGDADGYCRVGWNGDYVQSLGMLSIICHYMLVYSKLGTVASTSAVCSVVLLVWIGVCQLYLIYPKAEGPRYEQAAWTMVGYASLGFWWMLAHLVGLLHYRLRYLNLFQSHLLRKRHHRLLASIREETEHCERLLKNILPPHVLVHLGGLLAHADHAAKGHQLQSKTIAERYHDCSFLFAKIGGLSKLVNDNSVDPHSMMSVLQIMFDRFDALADMFGVQKVSVRQVQVERSNHRCTLATSRPDFLSSSLSLTHFRCQVRKTANEYYLVAAGLPNPKILPNGEDRAVGIAGFGFAMINIMNVSAAA